MLKTERQKTCASLSVFLLSAFQLLRNKPRFDLNELFRLSLINEKEVIDMTTRTKLIALTAIAFVLLLIATTQIETSIQTDLLTQSEYYIRFVEYS